jgi:catechol 2,3-dioxygenase-like lactoylglutathione lyase family enzyme
MGAMINGAHVLLYSTNADADRAFLRDVLGFKHVDVGHGWLIFKLPPAEVAVHPAEPEALERAGPQLGTELYLMCDDVEATVKSLDAQGVRCGPLATERWGIRTTIRLPSGADLGLYQPLHQTAYDLD